MDHTAPAADAASRVEDAREVMTPQEAADFLRVKVDTLLRWRKDGVGPRYSQPNCRIVRYTREDLLAWLKEQQA